LPPPQKPKRRFVGRKGRLRRASPGSKDGKPKLSEEDQELARAVDRINANHDLLKALLFIVGQKVPDARKLILESYVHLVDNREGPFILTDLDSDERLKKVRYDELYHPETFDKKLTVGEILARSYAHPHLHSKDNITPY